MGVELRKPPGLPLERCITFLDAVCRPDGKHWTNERVVVFTEYAHTVDWLQRVLAQRGYADRLAVIEGSTPTEDREYIRSQFTADPAEEPVRVLLATDAAGEGIDLQTYCHRLVNFDIPFNPSRLEQRIGRIDRYGQTQEPEVFHFVPDDKSLDLCRRRRLHGPHRQEGRPGRIGPRVGQPGDRRGDPATLRRPRPGQAQGQRASTPTR